MPRKARIDAPGVSSSHKCVWNRAQEILLDDADRDNFVSRLGQVLVETGTDCFAWALIANHIHLLLHLDSFGFDIRWRYALDVSEDEAYLLGLFTDDQRVDSTNIVSNICTRGRLDLIAKNNPSIHQKS